MSALHSVYADVVHQVRDVIAGADRRISARRVAPWRGAAPMISLARLHGIRKSVSGASGHSAGLRPKDRLPGLRTTLTTARLSSQESSASKEFSPEKENMSSLPGMSA